MNILYAGFNGKNNSSKILLDKINSMNKLYLKNSFFTSENQLKKELSKNNYDLIIMFGQADLGIDTIKIEIIGKKALAYKTRYDYDILVKLLKNNNYKVIISEDAGNYLCNNIYYYGLKYIDDNLLNTNIIFIHIPKINNITDIDDLAILFNIGFK